MIGAFTHQIDAVEIIVIAFFVYFAGLIYYLRREDKREGYPLDDHAPRRGPVEGFPAMPPPKRFVLLDEETTYMPHHPPTTPLNAEPLGRFPGAPLVPVGNPMLAEVGPGAYPLRKNKPMKVMGEPQLQALAAIPDWQIAAGDPDPRGMRVFDARRESVGTVQELWVDRGAKILRYLELELDEPAGAQSRVLLPIYYADIQAKRRKIRVRTLLKREFVDIPRPARSTEITAREEDQVNAYYAGSLLFGGARRRTRP